MAQWNLYAAQLAIMLLSTSFFVHAFVPVTARTRISFNEHASLRSSSSGKNEWNGEVVPDEGGKIRGCSIQPATPDSITEWKLTIDGVEADLGRFSEAIYKKMIGDAKKQRFQGFRPGTIPPHLQPTYIAFTMDECARETVLEALQQNNIRPFTDCRTEMMLKQFEIPPVAAKKKGSEKKRSNKKGSGVVAEEQEEEEPTEQETQWRSFETIKEAITAGWRPGQSFSFKAINVRGQKVKDQSEVDGATPVMKF